MNLINYNLANREFDIISSYLKKGIPNKEAYKQGFTFVRVPNLDKDSRWLLRKATNKYPNAHLVILSTNNVVAKFAWKIQALHFLSYPLTNNQLKVLKLKVQSLSKKREDEKKLKMTYKGGFVLFHPNEISVIQGQGNYCKFYLKNDKSQLFTARIGELYDKLDYYPFMCRINRSLIVNVNHLSRIQGVDVYFGSQPKVQLKLNRRVVTAIKKELLWL